MLGILVSTLVVTGCTSDRGEDKVAVTAPEEDARPRTLAQEFPDTRDLLRNRKIQRLLRDCPVTRPNHSIPPGEEQNPGAERAAYHGNGKLWTILYGIVYRDPSGVKFPWWRGVSGRLTITGSRRGGGQTLRARIPTGYGPIGFQSTAIFFPTAGCWTITGAAGHGSLTFVTLVIKG